MGFLKNIFKRQAPAAAKPSAEATAAAAAAPASPTAPPPLAGAGPTGRDVSLRKIVTEKATALEARGQYTFALDVRASRATVKQAIRQRFGVVPQAVRLITVRPRPVRFGRRTGLRKAYKKAIVQLPPGAKIAGEKSVKS